MVITMPRVFGIEEAPDLLSIGYVVISCRKPLESGCYENLYMYGFSPNGRLHNCSEFQMLSGSRDVLVGMTVAGPAKDRLFEIVRRTTRTWKTVSEVQEPVAFGTDIDFYVLLKESGKLYTIGDNPSPEAIDELARGLRMVHPRLAMLLQDLAYQIEAKR